MRFRIGCELDYLVPKDSLFLFNVAAADGGAQSVDHEQLRLTPDLPAQELVMPATGMRFTRVAVPAGALSLRYRAQVDCWPQTRATSRATTTAASPTPPAPRGTPPPEAKDTPAAPPPIPPDVVPYLFSSRYCQADLLADLAHGVAGNAPPGPPGVAAVCDWVFGHLEYMPGASDSATTALETARDRAGVCRDFAHLAIALCRAVGIPARFVTGYAWGLPLPDFHACMEAFFDGRWHLFDPSRKVAPERLVRIGTGRDAADTSFATIFGDGAPSEMTGMKVIAEPA